jgi:4-hydroxy-tetrahydrodipicolinate reductase
VSSTTSSIKLAIIGPGKMGRAVAELAGARGIQVVATLGPKDRVDRESLADADVAIEFTEPDVAAANVRACVAANCPVVVGTTGWYEHLPEIERLVADKNGAVFWAANFSLGVHAVAQLMRRAGEIFARLHDFDVAMVETHHAAKKDAPSGTASMLREQFAAGSGRTVPITSVRVGSVPGTHQLILDAPFEQLVISHEARDRRVFADGALAAAMWLVGRHGVFTLDDMLSEGDVR